MDIPTIETHPVKSIRVIYKKSNNELIIKILNYWNLSDLACLYCKYHSQKGCISSGGSSKCIDMIGKDKYYKNKNHEI